MSAHKFLAKIIIIFLLSGVYQVSGLTLDWNDVVWNSGDLTNSYDVDGDSINDITITVTPDFATNSPPTGAFTNLSSTGLFAPVKDTVFTGGGGATNENLYIGVDFGDRDQLVTVTVDFAQPVTDVSYTLYDIDFNSGQFRDIISVAAATDGSGNFDPTFTTGTSNTQAGFDISGQPFVFGTGASGGTSSNGNLGINYGTNEITSFSFNYSSTPNNIGDGATPTNPGVQGIGLHDINFNVVPEASTIWALFTMLVFFLLYRYGKSLLRKRPFPEGFFKV